MLLEKRKIGIESIVKETGSSMDAVHTISREYFPMRKVCARVTEDVDAKNKECPSHNMYSPFD